VPEVVEAAGAAGHRSVLTQESFITFYRQATPIDVIESSRIGSRPARRTGQHTLADLRAIPWVFSWSQARFLLSGWYGLGTALEALHAEQPGHFDQLRQQVFEWPILHNIVSNAATNIMLADRSLMEQYAGMVEDEALRRRLMALILEELERTTHWLEDIYGGPLIEQRTNVAQTIRPRQAPLARLHRQQIDLLCLWRQSGDAALLPQLLATVNAIANGLGTTG
jgi:phosphoenolpyruvate carboxylase